MLHRFYFPVAQKVIAFSDDYPTLFEVVVDAEHDLWSIIYKDINSGTEIEVACLYDEKEADELLRLIAISMDKPLMNFDTDMMFK